MIQTNSIRDIPWNSASCPDQETGHTGPITIITQTGYQRFYGASQVIAANLQDRLGAEVDFQVTDWPTIWNRQKDPDDRWHITFTGWGFVHSGNPFTSGFMDSSWLVGYDREDNDVTRELYALRDQFATAGSLAEKQDLAARIQRLFFEDVPVNPHGWLLPQDITGANVKGYENTASPAFWGVWVEQ